MGGLDRRRRIRPRGPARGHDPDPHAGHAVGARRGRERERGASRGARRGGRARSVARSRADDRGDTGAERASLRGVRRGRAVGVARWFFVRRVVKNVVVAAPRLLRRRRRRRPPVLRRLPVRARQDQAASRGRGGDPRRVHPRRYPRPRGARDEGFGRHAAERRGAARRLVRRVRVVQATDDGAAANDDENDEAATTSRGRTDAAVPLCAGAFAAAVAWGVGYPADLVKTRVQVARGEVGGGGDARARDWRRRARRCFARAAGTSSGRSTGGLISSC